MKTKIILLSLLLVAVFFLTACTSDSRQQDKVTKIEVGQTFDALGPIKLLDEQHFVAASYDIDYKTQEALEKHQSENAPI